MPNDIKTKSSFGAATVDHFSPPRKEDWPKAINVVLSFEEALKLHLGLGRSATGGQWSPLGKLNSYNRNTKAGRDSAVNLCLYPQAKRITINEAQVKKVKD
jgi:hypothetical protein